MGRRFAYGKNCVVGVGCPAVQAGFEDDPSWQTVMISLYDDRLGDLKGNRFANSGIVPEPEARQAWQEALERAEGDVEAFGEKVADKLGWRE